jgi:hypothetical protein
LIVLSYLCLSELVCVVQGATIRGIQMDSGAKLDLESDDLTGSSCLEISGSKHQVDMAKRAVEKVSTD